MCAPFRANRARWISKRALSPNIMCCRKAKNISMPSRRRSRVPTGCFWQPTPTVKGRPSPGICWRPSGWIKRTPASRSSGSSSTRSPKRPFCMPSRIPATSPSIWWMPSRPVRYWITWSASTSRRFSGKRSATAFRPAGSSRWPCAWSANGKRRFRPSSNRSTGLSPPGWALRRDRSSRPAWWRWAAKSWASSTFPARRSPTGLKTRPAAGQLPGGQDHQEREKTQPVASLYHLDPAAGGITQARLLGQEDHVDRPEAL